MYARDNVAHASDLQERRQRDSVIEAASVMLSMLGDATRLGLLAELLGGERDVSTLTEAIGAARPAISQHLAKLRLSGLVQMRRAGRRAVYSLADEHVRRLVTEALYAAEHRLSDRPGHHSPKGPPAPNSPEIPPAQHSAEGSPAQHSAEVPPAHPSPEVPPGQDSPRVPSPR
jgi:DNA-binding transcriptional ArsR family regulator